MFDNLTNKLNNIVQNITGKSKITEDNINDMLREIRLSLLDADVALPVVKEFINQVKEKVLGQKVFQSLTPGQTFVSILKQELTDFMGSTNSELNLSHKPTIILMAGLQGAGKTTTCAKLANLLKKQKKKVLLASVDIYRAAAIKQLKILAKTIEVDFFQSDKNNSIEIAKDALYEANKSFYDVLIIDSAGRLTIDEQMMTEINNIDQIIKPHETLFIIDAMTGQDAVKTAKAFDEYLSLTGIILTKADGDSRGGAALSVKFVTKKPIKYIGVGEKIENLEVFHPDRIASRILGMGDVLGLIEKTIKEVDDEKARKLTQKLKKGKKFNLEDFQEQMIQMNKMGGLSSFMDKMPSFGGMQFNKMESINNVAEKSFKQMNAIICSMTKKEKRNPDVINGSRKKRIAKGSGTEIQDVNRLLKQHKQMQKMMSAFTSKGGMQKIMQGMGKIVPGSGFKF